jgi:hypothetical protein
MAKDDCLFIGSHSRLTLPDNLLENNSQRAVHLPHQTKLAPCNDYNILGRKIVRYHISFPFPTGTLHLLPGFNVY